MYSLEEIAKKKFLLNSSEIFSLEFENQKYWLKKARKTKQNKIQKFFYSFLSFELLIPSLSKNSFESLEYETKKLDKFRSLEINTPKVVYKCENFFILEDTGKTVHSLIRKKISQKDLYYYIDKMLLELSKIHNNSLFHGGSQTRNFTYQNNKVYIIDLEESFDSNIDIRILQFRDFLLFLLSFVKIRTNFDIDYEYIINKYVELTKNNNIKIQLKELANKFSFLIYISDIKFLQKLLGSDVKGVLKLFKILKKL